LKIRSRNNRALVANCANFFAYVKNLLYLCGRKGFDTKHKDMKKKIFVLLSVVCCAGIMSATEGALSGKFTINAQGKKIVFSQGNLQYQASTQTWQFAAQQTAYLGAANEQISSTNSGWIDLFGWGTGRNPTANSIGSSSDYASFTDWGVNAISNGGNAANLWRTLKKEEWVYLIQSRTKASTLFGMGIVDGVRGMILLPDDWQLPDGVTFVPSTQQGLQDLGIHYQNESKNNFSHNSYTGAQWSQMEAAGAVFLPAAGGRFGSEVYMVGENGYYWSATPDEYTDYFSHLMYYDSEFLFPQGYTGAYRGLSVRLVKSAETEGLTDAIDKTSNRSIKSLRDGQLLIERNGKVYNSLGAEVKKKD